MDFPRNKENEERIDKVLFVRVENEDNTFSIYSRLNLVQNFLWMGCKANSSYKMTKMFFKILTKAYKIMLPIIHESRIPQCPPMDNSVLSSKKSLQKKKKRKKKSVVNTKFVNGEVITSVEEVGETDDEEEEPETKEEEDDDEDSEEDGEKSFCSSSTDCTTAFFSRKFSYDTRFMSLEEFGLKSKKVRNERSNVHLNSKMSKIVGKQYFLKYRFFPEYMNLITDFEGIMMMTREDFLSIIKICLVAFNYNRIHRIEYFDLSCRFQDRKLFTIILLGGTSGTGKSTLGSLLSSRLGIDRFVSTDSIRHCLRENESLSRKEKGILFSSSYNVGNLEYFSHIKRLTKRTLYGYKMHCELLFKHLDLLIQGFVVRRESVILEGVHLTPATMIRLLRKYKDQNIFPYMIHIMNESKHRMRFSVRVKHMTLDPDKNKYIKYFSNIRLIQSYLLKQAKLFSLPMINNTVVDRSVAFLHYSLLKTIKLVTNGDYTIWDEGKKQIQMVDPNKFTDKFKSKRMLEVMKKKRRHLLITSGGEGFKRRRKKPRPLSEEKEVAGGFVHEDKTFLTNIGTNSQKGYASDSALKTIEKSKRQKKANKRKESGKKSSGSEKKKVVKHRRLTSGGNVHVSSTKTPLTSPVDYSPNIQPASSTNSFVVGMAELSHLRDRPVPIPHNVVKRDFGLMGRSNTAIVKREVTGSNTSDWNSQTGGESDRIASVTDGNQNSSEEVRKSDIASSDKQQQQKRTMISFEEKSIENNNLQVVEEEASTQAIIDNPDFEDRWKHLKKLKKKFPQGLLKLRMNDHSDTKSGHAGSDSSNNDDTEEEEGLEDKNRSFDESSLVKRRKKKVIVKRAQRKKVKKKIIVVSSKSMISLQSTSSEEEEEEKRRKKVIMRKRKEELEKKKKMKKKKVELAKQQLENKDDSKENKNKNTFDDNMKTEVEKEDGGGRRRGTVGLSSSDDDDEGHEDEMNSTSSDEERDEDDEDEDEAMNELDGESDDDDPVAAGGEDDDGINELVREKKKEMREKDEKEKKKKEIEKKKKEKVRRRKKLRKDVKEKGEMIIVRQRNVDKNLGAFHQQRSNSMHNIKKRKASSDNERM